MLQNLLSRLMSPAPEHTTDVHDPGGASEAGPTRAAAQQSLRWLLHLVHGVGQSGAAVTPLSPEWDEALEEAARLLAAREAAAGTRETFVLATGGARIAVPVPGAATGQVPELADQWTALAVLRAILTRPAVTPEDDLLAKAGIAIATAVAEQPLAQPDARHERQPLRRSAHAR